MSLWVNKSICDKQLLLKFYYMVIKRSGRAYSRVSVGGDGLILFPAVGIFIKTIFALKPFLDYTMQNFPFLPWKDTRVH